MSESNVDNSGRKRRRAPRLRLKTPVSVSWVGSDGERQDSSGTTQNVNAYGALVLIMVGNRPPEGCELQLTSLITKIVATAKVIWTGTTATADVYALGLELATPQPAFWPES